MPGQHPLFRTLVCSNISVCLQIAVPQHRMTPLKKTWLDIYKTVTEILKFDMRMNLKTRKVAAHSSCARLCISCDGCRATVVPQHRFVTSPCTVQVEIKTNKTQQDTGLLQKAADYVHAYLLGAHDSSSPTELTSGSVKCMTMGVPLTNNSQCDAEHAPLMQALNSRMH